MGFVGCGGGDGTPSLRHQPPAANTEAKSPVCGDKVCDAGETHASCPSDCPDNTPGSGCSSDEMACAGGCVPTGTRCCGTSLDGTAAVYCRDGDATCSADSTAENGWRCTCPGGQKFCDHYCIPEGASCCGDGSATYCETGTCKPDSSQPSGYGCFGSSNSNECSNDSDCGGTDYCENGECHYGECSYSGDCGECSRCDSHQCYYCGYGPYGCYC